MQNKESDKPKKSQAHQPTDESFDSDDTFRKNIVFLSFFGTGVIYFFCWAGLNDHPEYFWQVSITGTLSYLIFLAMFVQAHESKRQWQVTSAMLTQIKTVERPILIVRRVGAVPSAFSKTEMLPFIVVRNKGRTAATKVCIFFEFTDCYRTLIFPMPIDDRHFPATRPMLAVNEKVKFAGGAFTARLPDTDAPEARIIADDGTSVKVDPVEFTIYGHGFYYSLSGERYNLEPFVFECAGGVWRSAPHRIMEPNRREIMSEAIGYIQASKK